MGGTRAVTQLRITWSTKTAPKPILDQHHLQKKREQMHRENKTKLERKQLHCEEIKNENANEWEGGSVTKLKSVGPTQKSGYLTKGVTCAKHVTVQTGVGKNGPRVPKQREIFWIK